MPFAARLSLGRTTDVPLALRKAGQRLLEETTEVVGLTYPQLRVTQVLAHGSPAEVLVGESETAERLVLGSRGAGAFDELLVGSTALQVSGLAACPVVVVPVPPAEALPRHGVVVGIDGSSVSQAALGFAFGSASLFAEPLVAVHAWTDPARTAPGEQLPLVYDPDLVAHEERLVLAEATAGYLEQFPDVKFDARVVHDHPVRALRTAAVGARLLVVGSRGRGTLGALFLGSVSHGVLHHATAPVAVVPGPRRARSGVVHL